MLFSPQILIRRPPGIVAAAGGTFSFISGNSTTGNSGGGTTGAIDTTGAGLLILVTTNYFDAAGITSVTDNKSNTWTSLTAATSSGGDPVCNIHHCKPTTVGSGHTVTISGPSGYSSLFFASFALGAASPLDQQSGTFGTGSTALASSITPGVNNELVIAGVCNGTNSSTTDSINGGFTTIGTSIQGLASNYLGGWAAYLIQTTAAAAAPTWTFSASSSWAAKMASFKVS